MSFFEGFQGIFCFAGLTDGDDEVVGGSGRVSVSVFGSEFDLTRDLGECFEPILSGEGGVVGRTAPCDEDSGYFEPIYGGEGRDEGGSGSVFGQEGSKGFMEDERLFCDFFFHEMLVVSFADLVGGYVVFDEGEFEFIPEVVENGEVMGLDVGPLAVFEIDNILGVGSHTKSIGADVVMVVFCSLSDDERASMPSSVKCGRLGEEEGNKGVGTFKFFEGMDEGFFGRESVFCMPEVEEESEDGGIVFDVCGELVLRGEFVVIFDDSVVNDGNGRGDMGVGIFLSDGSMSSPSGMADSGGSAERLSVDEVFEVEEFSDGLSEIPFLIMNGGDSRGVVASVLEIFEAREDMVCNILVACNADNSAHNLGRGFFRFSGRFEDLPCTGEGALIMGYIVDDNAAGCCEGVSTDGEGRNEGRVGTDEGVFFDGGMKFLVAVIIGDDGSGSDIDVFFEVGIANVGEMRSFCVWSDAAIFDFDKGTDFGVGFDRGLRTNTCEGADLCMRFDGDAFEVGEGFDDGMFFDDDSFSKDGEGSDGGMLFDDGVVVEDDGFWVREGDADAIHEVVLLSFLPCFFDQGEVCAGIDSEEFVVVRSGQGSAGVFLF